MLPMPDLNQLAHDIHQENLKWWQDMDTGEPIQTPAGQKEMLMISEVAEAMEGLRKGLMDDKLPHRPMAEVEAADYVIRVLDHANAHGCLLNNELAVVHNDYADEATEAELLLDMCASALGVYSEVETHTTCIVTAINFASRMGYDLWAAVDEKRAYNRQREDHKLEHRKAEGGKKW